MEFFVADVLIFHYPAEPHALRMLSFYCPFFLLKHFSSRKYQVIEYLYIIGSYFVTGICLVHGRSMEFGDSRNFARSLEKNSSFDRI